MVLCIKNKMLMVVTLVLAVTIVCYKQDANGGSSSSSGGFSISKQDVNDSNSRVAVTGMG